MSPATQFILLTLYTICFLCVSVSADETLNVAVSLFLNDKNDYSLQYGSVSTTLYCFNLFVCPHHFVFSWAVESSPYRFWRWRN